MYFGILGNPDNSQMNGYIVENYIHLAVIRFSAILSKFPSALVSFSQKWNEIRLNGGRGVLEILSQILS